MSSTRRQVRAATNGRRQISMKRATYDKLKAFAKAADMSMSSVVEQLLAPTLGQPLPPARRPRRYRGPRDN